MRGKSNIRKCFLSVSLLLFTCGCVPAGKPPPGRTVRVALLQGANAVTPSSRSVLKVRDAHSGRTLSTSRPGKSVTIRFAPNGLDVSGTSLPVEDLYVKSTSNEISLGGKTYSGSLRILRRKGGLLAVNLVDLDTYLKAVVPSEMLPSWPLEALKAQAVVSRSFVLFHALRNRRKDYDISSNTQAYNPDKRDARTDKAVEATRDIVLYYRAEVLLPYFCTCCGGFTEYAANVWEAEGRFPPPVRCPFCREASDYRWQARITFDEMRRKLDSAGLSGARRIAVHRRSASGGRVTALKIECEDGEKIVRLNRFRMIMGPNVIRSGFFDIEVKDGSILFRGRGWGHGVGMCQRGAKVLAERGKSFKSIFRYYFPGARTGKMRW